MIMKRDSLSRSWNRSDNSVRQERMNARQQTFSLCAHCSRTANFQQLSEPWRMKSSFPLHKAFTVRFVCCLPAESDVKTGERYFIAPSNCMIILGRFLVTRIARTEVSGVIEVPRVSIWTCSARTDLLCSLTFAYKSTAFPRVSFFSCQSWI